MSRLPKEFPTLERTHKRTRVYIICVYRSHLCLIFLVSRRRRQPTAPLGVRWADIIGKAHKCTTITNNYPAYYCETVVKITSGPGNCW